MSFFTAIIYGFISGITEILPVSSQGHQALMRYLFGAETRIPLLEILVHTGALLALLFSCSEVLKQLRREQRTLSSRYRKKKRQKDNKNLYELRLMKSSAIVLFLALFTYYSTKKFENSLTFVMIFWLVNAFILFIADHMPRGNRDARTMSALDGVVMGLLGAVSVLPGISRTGMITSYAVARGADNDTSANWALLLGIPALIFYILFDLVALISVGSGVQTMAAAAVCFLSGGAAFAGCYFGISLLKLIINQSGLSKFAFYSIGVTMFSFAIYLIT